MTQFLFVKVTLFFSAWVCRASPLKKEILWLRIFRFVSKSDYDKKYLLVSNNSELKHLENVTQKIADKWHSIKFVFVSGNTLEMAKCFALMQNSDGKKGDVYVSKEQTKLVELKPIGGHFSSKEAQNSEFSFM